MAYENIHELAGYDLNARLNDSSYGALNFEEIRGNAERIQKMLIELMDLDYESHLTPSENREIDGIIKEFTNYIKKITAFQVTDSNPAGQRNDIVSSFKRQYEERIKKLRLTLTMLRFESLQSEKLLSEQKKQLDKSSQLNEKLELMVDEIENKLSQLSQGSGTLGTTILHQEYDGQQPDYDTEKQEWLSNGKKIFRALLILVGITLVTYILLTTFGSSESVKRIFNIEFGVLFAILVSLGFYGVSFCSRKYDIISNIANQNKHRSNVAKTFAYFLASGNKPYESFLTEVARALFAHTDSGYITKKATEINSPLIKMITEQFNKDPS